MNFGELWSILVKSNQIWSNFGQTYVLTRFDQSLTKVDQNWPNLTKLTKTEKYGFVPDKMGPIDFIIVLKLFFVGNAQKHFL